jgi:DUF438 domain-containing protein
MSDDDDQRRAIKQKVSGIFDKLLDRYEESMHERIMRSWCMVFREEKALRLRTIEALSVELARIRQVSIQATRIGETAIEDIIEGDWKSAELIAGDLEASFGADHSLWETFIAIVKTAAAESKRVTPGVRSEGN